jgi:hypothetical protein
LQREHPEFDRMGQIYDEPGPTLLRRTPHTKNVSMRMVLRAGQRHRPSQDRKYEENAPHQYDSPRC